MQLFTFEPTFGFNMKPAGPHRLSLMSPGPTYNGKHLHIHGIHCTLTVLNQNSHVTDPVRFFGGFSILTSLELYY